MEFHEFDTKDLIDTLPKIAELVTSKKIVSIRYLGGGSYGRAFSVKDDTGYEYVLKAYRRKGMNLDEATQLTKLGENTSVPMPQVLFTHNDDGYSVLAMTKIAGINTLNPIFLMKSKRKKRAFAEEVVNGMLEWHSVTNPKFGSLSSPAYDTWYEYYRAEKIDLLLSHLENNPNACDEKTLDLIKKGIKIYEKIGDNAKEAVLIHGDLNIMNIMADKRSMKVTGFIDPCGCMWGSREYDLYQLRNMWGDSFRLYEVYKEKFPLDAEADFRIAFYAVVNEVLCGINSGEHIAPIQFLCNRKLKKAMKRLELD